jgi:tetratricopeptide (TPR) repeat protein
MEHPTAIAIVTLFAVAAIIASCGKPGAPGVASGPRAPNATNSKANHIDEKVPSAHSPAPMTRSAPARARPTCDHLTELWDFDAPENSARRFEKAAQDAAAASDSSCELEALTQLARARGLQGNFDDANRVLDQVDHRLAGDVANRPALRSKLERGRVLNSSKHPDAAYALFVDAWHLARQLGEDGLAVDAAHMVAIAKLKEPDLALEWNLKALELAQSSSADDARGWLGSLYNNIGWTYFEAGDYEDALAVFRQGVEVREKQPQPKPLLIAKWSVARTLRALKRTEEALAAQERLLAEYETRGLEPTGFVYEELAECKLELGQPGHHALFARAYSILSEDKWLAENEPQRLERLLRLSKP